MSKQTEISSALDRLQQFAGDLINMETARRIQLGKEKEARVAEAYKYLMSREESKINQHETAIDSLTQNLMDRGIELKSVKDEYKTVASEELLSAANESAISMLDVMLNDAKMQEQSWRSRLRDVQSVARHVDLFDDAMKMVNPAATGDQHGSNRKRNTVGGLPYTNTEIMNNYFFTFLDSPASTSAQTYGVVFTNGAGGSTGTAYVNQGTSSDDASRGSYTSVITAMEVVA